MRLYYVPNAPVGVRWQGTQADAKGAGKTFASEFIQREVPVDKPNLLDFLNAEESVIVQQEPMQQVAALDPLQQAELRAVAAARPDSLLHYDYQALDARSGLAAMDAGMISRQIEQLHGPDLGKVVTACIKRISAIAAAATGGTDGA